MKHHSSAVQFLSIAIVVSLVLLFVYGFLFQVIFTTNRSLQALEEDVSTQAGREERLRAARNILANTESERTNLASSFLRENEVVSFIELVEELENTAGAELRVQSVDLKDADDNSTVYEWLELAIEATGSWQEVYHFLSLVEHMPVSVFLVHARIRHVESIGDEEAPIEPWLGSFTIRIAKEKME